MSSGNRIITAKRLLIRYIESEGMHRGDKLPSYEFFRRRFGFGMTTISSAFESLRLDGVLEIRDKVGVFLLDPHPDGYFAYVVGMLVSNWIHGTPYYTQLLNAVHLSLVRLGCQVRFYFARPPKHHTPHLPLTEVIGLKTSLRKKELDALIHLDHLSCEDYASLLQYELPLLYIGTENKDALSSNAYYLFDVLKMGEELCRITQACGIRRPLLQVAPSLSFVCESFGSGLDGHVSTCVTDSLEENDRITELILGCSAELRPDGLVFLDDLAALRVLCGLATRLPRSEIPRAFIVENRQLSLSYPVEDAVLYSIDLESIARGATGYLFENLKADRVRFESHHHELPRLQGTVRSCMVPGMHQLRR